MFLIGGPAFCGTTLLTHLLNQDGIVCLDEPDFHQPEQRHRGVPYLEQLFPQQRFPDQPGGPLSYREAASFIEQCQVCVQPVKLGIKACDWSFIEYAQIYQACGYPIVGIIRDIRDVLVRPLEPERSEASLNRSFRDVWSAADLADLWIRYEDLVSDPERVFEKLSEALSIKLRVRSEWPADSVHRHMLKMDRHEMLRQGQISSARAGIWSASGKKFSRDTHVTAELMGY